MRPSAKNGPNRSANTGLIRKPAKSAEKNNKPKVVKKSTSKNMTLDDYLDSITLE